MNKFNLSYQVSTIHLSMQDNFWIRLCKIFLSSTFRITLHDPSSGCKRTKGDHVVWSEMLVIKKSYAIESRNYLTSSIFTKWDFDKKHIMNFSFPTLLFIPFLKNRNILFHFPLKWLLKILFNLNLLLGFK